MTQTKLNIELFKKVRDRIATIPESYDQEKWVRESRRSPCGVTACLAGEAIICNAPNVTEGVGELWALSKRDKNDVIPARAAELLGLRGSWKEFIETGKEEFAGETIIFDGTADNWPAPYRYQYKDHPAEAAVAYLDHIISTGKVLE